MLTTLLIGVIVVETILLFGQAHSIKLNHRQIDDLARALEAAQGGRRKSGAHHEA